MGAKELSDYRTMKDIVVSKLREMIMDGTLAPGAPLKQRELAEQLGVSTQPVRAGISLLATEALVVMRPHRTVLVANFSIDEIRDIYIVRVALEGMAAKLGAEKLTREDLETLHEIVSQNERAVELGDRDAVLQLNREFHSTIYLAAECAALYTLLETKWRVTEMHRRRSYTVMPGYMERALEGHKRILQACVGHHPELVRRLTEEHLEHTRDVLLAWLQLSATVGQGQESVGVGKSDGPRR